MLAGVTNAAGPCAPVATYGVGDSATWAHLAVAPNAVLVKDVRTLGLWRVP